MKQTQWHSFTHWVFSLVCTSQTPSWSLHWAVRWALLECSCVHSFFFFLDSRQKSQQWAFTGESSIDGKLKYWTQRLGMPLVLNSFVLCFGKGTQSIWCWRLTYINIFIYSVIIEKLSLGVINQCLYII